MKKKKETKKEGNAEIQKKGGKIKEKENKIKR